MNDKFDFSNLTKDLCKIKTGIVENNNKKFFERVEKEIPLRYFSVPSESEFNGWVVPKQWSVKKASIYFNGNEIYDGTKNPLGVAFYSQSFSGKLTLDELKKHLYFNDNPVTNDAHMYHCSWLYKPWIKDWGLTPPASFVKNLKDGEYQIELETSFESGEMIIADCHIKGEKDETIILQSHTCHPHMANDGFAGTSIMIRLMQNLMSKKNLFSYRLILCPEHLGTIFYLNQINSNEINNFVGGVFSEMLGSSSYITMGSTFWGNHYLDSVMGHVGKFYLEEFKMLPFRQTVGNDETVWESPGYEIPFVQINRTKKFGFPFEEYHSSLDTPDIIDNDKLNEAYNFLNNSINIIEKNAIIKRKFKGLIALSNPKYNLYKNRIDPTYKHLHNYDNERFGYLQDCIFRYMEGNMSILEIANRHEIPFFELYEWLKIWEEKKLISLEPLIFDKNLKSNTEKINLSWLN